nr:MAG TPA: tail component [Caudoviricetes sp.]
MPTMASAVDFETVLLRMLQEDAGLSALVGSKVFPLFIPSGNFLPCVTFQRIGGRPANTLSGASGLEEIDLQIDVWARDYDEAKAIAKAVRAAMPPSGDVFGAHLIEDQDLYENGTTYFRVSMEYKVWFLETE